MTTIVRTAPPEVGSLAPSARTVVTVVIALLLAPSVAWILAERIVWPWDQAWYAEITLQIAHALPEGVGAWLQAMLSKATSKAPLLPWAAQATLPLAGLLGGPERAFLLFNVACGAGTLALVYAIARRLGASTLAALAAVLLCGGASLFIGMTHQFVVEPVQSLTVAGLMRVSLEASRMPLLRLTAAALLWVALAFLAKTTSVGFTAPFLLYIVLARLGSRGQPKAAPAPADRWLALAAALVLAATVAWYGANWSAIVSHFINATASEVALHYGSVGTLGSKLRFWIGALMQAITPWTPLAAAALLGIVLSLGLAAFRVLRHPWRAWLPEAVRSGTLFAFCLAGTVLAGLLAYASQINEETRFLTPMLPLVAVLLAFALTAVNARWLALACTMLFAASAVAGHLHAHGLVSLAPHNSPWLKPYRVEPGSMARLTRAVELSCPVPVRPHYSIVGTELHDFNANSAAFYVKRLRGAEGETCYYTSLGYAETDVEKAVRRVYDLNTEFYVTLPFAQIPADPADVLNVVALQVARRIAESPDFERITGDQDTVQVFRRRR